MKQIVESTFHFSRDWLELIAQKRPLVECLTNTVTVTDVANVILAVGASPVKGDALEEVGDFVRQSSAVVLNLGTVSGLTRGAFESAMAEAASMGKPVVLDPVGVGAAKFRTELAMKLLQAYPCAVIRGNASEIRTLAEGAGDTVGVDVSVCDVVTEETLPARIEMAQAVARKYGCVVSMSGRLDVLSDGTRSMVCRNGVDWMSQVTGTGCSLTGLTAAFIAVASPEDRLEAAAVATTMMGVAGEMSYVQTRHQGLGSFHVSLLDALSMMTDGGLERQARLSVVDKQE